MNNFAPMKKIVAIALVSLIMLPNFSNILVYFSYKINQAEIARTLCVQKDLVKNTCNGRCVLETKLKKLEQNQKNNEINIKEKCELVYIVENSLPKIDFPSFNFNSSALFFKKTIGNPLGRIFDFFHPPTV